MSEGVCRKGAGKGGLKREERGLVWSGGWGGRSARCCRGVGNARGGWEVARRKRSREGNKSNYAEKIDNAGRNRMQRC